MSNHYYISEETRSKVAARAQFKCEYCLISERYSYFKFHVDHIVSKKHGGSNTLDNLSLSCPQCNLNKGTDIATLLEGTSHPVPFFNPRKEKWDDHFKLEASGIITPLSLKGKATIKIFKINQPDSVMERKLLL